MTNIRCFIVLIFCFSCTSKTNEDIVSFKEIEIPISSSLMNGYRRGFYFNSLGEKGLFGAYNYTSHAIDLFDLANSKFYKSISLQEDGPEYVSTVEGIAYLSQDSTFLIEDFYGFHKLDLNGKIVANFPLYKSINLEGYEFQMSGVRTYGSQFSEVDVLDANYLLHRVFAYVSRTDPTFYKGKPLCLISLNEYSAELLDIPFSEQYVNDFYGDLDEVYAELKEDYVIYNFPISSDIFIYDLKKSEVKKVKAESRLTKNESSPINLADYRDSKKRMNYVWASSQFFPIKWDEERQLYYRMHKDFTPLKEGQSSAMNYSQADEFYLMIFDEDLNTLAELRIPGKFLPEYVITDQGLIFQLKHDLRADENTLKLYLLAIEELFRL